MLKQYLNETQLRNELLRKQLVQMEIEISHLKSEVVDTNREILVCENKRMLEKCFDIET